MSARLLIAVVLLVGLLRSSALASSASKTFKGTPEQIFAAAEQALRENSRVLSVEPNQKQLKIQFKGPRTSGLEQYSAFSGDASVSVVPNTLNKCILTISVNDVHLPPAGDPRSVGPEPAFSISTASEKSFANSVFRRVRHILGQ